MDDEQRKAVSFRDAERGKLIPDRLQWGTLDTGIRNSIWTVLYLFIKSHVDGQSYSFAVFDPLKGMLLSEHVNNRLLPIDEFLEDIRYLDDLASIYKKIIFEGDYVEVMQFLQFIMRLDQTPSELTARLARALEGPRSPYRVMFDPPTIIPAISEEAGAAVVAATEAISASDAAGGKSHLQKAADCLNKGDNGGAIRESIHAVESTVRHITGDSGAKLSDGLKVIEEQHSLHSAFKKALNALYGYTSDEKGIRHSLFDKSEADVTSEEAVFFYSSCAIFVSYLLSVSRSET